MSETEERPVSDNAAEREGVREGGWGGRESKSE